MTYGERLLWARLRAEITQPELSKRTGVKQVSISKIERGGQGSSSFDSILAYHLGVSAYWLSTGDGDPDDGVFTKEDRRLIEAYKLSTGDNRQMFEFLKKQALTGAPPQKEASSDTEGQAKPPDKQE